MSFQVFSPQDYGRPLKYMFYLHAEHFEKLYSTWADISLRWVCSDYLSQASESVSPNKRMGSILSLSRRITSRLSISGPFSPSSGSPSSASLFPTEKKTSSHHNSYPLNYRTFFTLKVYIKFNPKRKAPYPCSRRNVYFSDI